MDEIPFRVRRLHVVLEVKSCGTSRKARNWHRTTALRETKSIFLATPVIRQMCQSIKQKLTPRNYQF